MKSEGSGIRVRVLGPTDGNAPAFEIFSSDRRIGAAWEHQGKKGKCLSVSFVRKLARRNPQYRIQRQSQNSNSASTPRDLATYVEQHKRALTVLELADLLALSKQQVYSLVQRGHIPLIKIAGSLRLDQVATAKWLRSLAA